MTKIQKALLAKAANPAGHREMSSKYFADIYHLARKGLLHSEDRLTKTRHGLAPMPHITITEKGRVVLEAVE